MINKKIIILIVTALLVGSAALAVYYWRGKGWFLEGGGRAVASCQLSTGRARDLCLKLEAQSAVNRTVCQGISDAGLKADCLNKIDMLTAVLKKDMSSCEGLTDLMMAKTCLKNIIEKDYKTADCAALSQPEQELFCSSEKNYLAALAAGDANLCWQIPETVKKANCLAEIKKIDLRSDSDKDGLNFLNEILSGTDPDKADTDGDGQPDGVEVANGYNPDGSGKLNEVFKTFIICADIKDIGLRAICQSEYNGGRIDLRTCEGIKNSKLLDFCLEERKSLLSQPAK